MHTAVYTQLQARLVECLGFCCAVNFSKNDPKTRSIQDLDQARRLALENQDSENMRLIQAQIAHIRYQGWMINPLGSL